MLNNITNFFNLIATRKIKTTMETTDLLPLGTRDSRYTGCYQPTAILGCDLLNQIGNIVKCDTGLNSTVRINSSNTASGNYSTTLGKTNTNSAAYGTISGGGFSCILNGQYSTIGGGQGNLIDAPAGRATIAGGNKNSALCKWSTISGGYCNTVSHCLTSVGGGFQNVASAKYGSIFGGCANTVSANYATITNGRGNIVSAAYGGILGGLTNTVSNACSFIVGSNITSDRACTTFVNALSMKTIPTSTAGLPSGMVWRCTVDNILRIIP
jgi:hypothetical protein